MEGANKADIRQIGRIPTEVYVRNHTDLVENKRLF